MNIWERIIREFQGLQGGGLSGPTMMRPDATWPNMGTIANFKTRGPGAPRKSGPKDKKFDKLGGSQWPYSRDPTSDEVDNLAGSGQPTGPRPPDRGTPMGMDVSGHPVSDQDDPYHLHKRGGAPEPSAKYQATWGDMREGTGLTTGPFTPLPIMIRGTEDAEPVKDVNGDFVSEPQARDDFDPKTGPSNMWGGAGTVPGQDRGFAVAPGMGENDPEITKWKPPEEKKPDEWPENLKMNLREFFDPNPPPTEEVENPEQTHEKDQTDDEVENKIDRVYGQEDNHEFDGGKEPDDDSAKSSFAKISSAFETDDGADGGVGVARDRYDDAVGAIDSAAGVIMVDDEPAGVVDMEGGSDGTPKAEVDSQDWQLTVEPEAGQMPTLSSMMGGSDGKPMGDIAGMTQLAQGLLPQRDSAWDTMDIKVGDALISLKKTGGAQPPLGAPPPAAPPLPAPPMMEKSRKRK